MKQQINVNSPLRRSPSYMSWAVLLEAHTLSFLPVRTLWDERITIELVQDKHYIKVGSTHIRSAQILILLLWTIVLGLLVLDNRFNRHLCTAVVITALSLASCPSFQASWNGSSILSTNSLCDVIRTICVHSRRMCMYVCNLKGAGTMTFFVFF